LNQIAEKEHSQYVRSIFARIASRYDLLNRLMTLGQDRRWRTEAIRRLQVSPSSRILDVGAGTGDIAIAIRHKHTDAFVVACDLTGEMIQVGRQRAGAEQVAWVIADAQHLPFAADAFAGVISGFLLRNVPSLEQALAEQYRVVAPGGKIAALDTTRPTRNVFYPIVQIQLRWIIPLLGKFIAGDSAAYHYLPESTRQFLSAEDLASRIRRAGFTAVGFTRRMFATIAIHWGEK